MKKVLSMILSLGLLASTTIPALAASTEAIEAANNLNSLGLFGGVGTNPDGTINFDLDRAMTRNEAVTMLVRLLGKEDEALSGTWITPFTDVVDWAKPYVGYAYTNGLTAGAGDNYFGGDETVSATQYLTFVLRALGYNSEIDFQWDEAWVLSDTIGFTYGEYNATTEFIRGDAAIVSYRALNMAVKGSGVTLYSMIAGGVVGVAENEVPSYQGGSDIGGISGPSTYFGELTISENSPTQNNNGAHFADGTPYDGKGGVWYEADGTMHVEARRDEDEYPHFIGADGREHYIRSDGTEMFYNEVTGRWEYYLSTDDRDSYTGMGETGDAEAGYIPNDNPNIIVV